MLPVEHQNILLFIEENTERLDLLEKSLQVEQRQKKRLEDLSKQQEKEREEASRRELYDGNKNTTLSNINEEEDQRKELVDAMIRHANPSNGPVVKVLTNVHGEF